MSIQEVSSQSPTSSSSSFSSGWKYDVFISFRGEDTRKNFTDHLYAALIQKGIKVFRDDNELERGKPISSELLQAIEESRFSLIVFSKNYASSTWCLDEIVKIVDCRNTKQQIVFPIFYDVHPSVVRKQTGVFREAFTKHEETFKENTHKVQNWRNALVEVTNLSGFDAKDRYESDFIQNIVQEISNKLSPATLRTFEDLVGMNSRLEKLRLLIGRGSNDVRMIGICGMGGIGKTTIARVIYELELHQFEGSGFLANVREISEKNGLVSLQRKLLSAIPRGQENNIFDEYDGIKEIKNRLQHKKVLVVIDDVAHIEQLNKLAGKHNWFGSGSRIIITTRDKHLLTTHGVDEIYEAKELNQDEALELLSLKAFKNHQPSEDYRKLSQLVVEYAGGLPLALKVLGSFLFGRSIDEWKDAIERLNRCFEKEILDKLQISFDGLEEIEKKIFLDVACFFKGNYREYVTRILDGCGFNPTIGISVLIEKSLLTLDFDYLSMHDLLQEMGQQIVKRESLKEPGKRSRLWDEKDIHHVLTKNTGTELVEAIVLENELHLSINGKAFSRMTNLRLLKIRKVQLLESLEYLSNELRFLDWDGYNLKSLPSNFQPDKLVEFKMNCSRIGRLWKGNKPLNTLKSISFKDCKSLTKTPDFSGIPNLEKLTLKRCSRLIEIHPSLLIHKKIKSTNLTDCSSLKTLPSKIHMESLERIVLSGCSKLKKFPEIIGSMECLWGLFLNETAIKELPSSVGLLVGLEELNLEGCKNLLSLPSTIDGLKSLRTLSLSYCSKLVSLPNTVDALKSLETLNLIECTKLANLPSSINGLKSLETLNLSNCSGLLSLPSTINGLKSLLTLRLSGCSKLENLPDTLRQVESLRTLNLRFTAIRQPVSSIFFMKNLLELDFCGCQGPPSNSSLKKSSNAMATLILPSLSTNLCSFRKLDLSYCNLLEGAIPSDFLGSLISLEGLDLSLNGFVSLPTSINRLSNLRDLTLKYCTELQILPELPSNLRHLKLDGCFSLETLSNALRLCKSNLSRISCQYCIKLLDGSNVAFSILKECLKGILINGRFDFNMIIPGSEIPEWFKHKSEGSSITIEKPPGFNNKSKLVGYIVCCVFYVHNDSHFTPDPDITCFNYATCMMTDDYPALALNDLNYFLTHFGLHIFEYEVVGLPELDHLCLYYLSHDDQTKGNNLKFSIRSSLREEIFGVKRCGVHPVYEQEDFVDAAITI